MAIIKRRTVAKKGGSRKFTPKRAVGKVVVKKSPTRVATKKVYKKKAPAIKLSPSQTLKIKKTLKTMKKAPSKKASQSGFVVKKMMNSVSPKIFGKKLSNMKKNVKMNKAKTKKKRSLKG